MASQIELDHQSFLDIIAGKKRKELKKFFKTSKFVTARGKNGKMSIVIPRIDSPYFTHGAGDEGIKRGKGKKGDVIGKDPSQGNGAGQEEADGIVIDISLEEVLMFFKDDLKLPDLKPKLNETFEETKIKYNSISLIGPESLRHNRRTMLQALKRLSSTGEADKLHMIPGFAQAVRMISPINSDRRYRQFKEIKIPSSNAVIMFGRDGSGSMDEYKCNVVSDMSFWISTWIRSFYEKTETCFFWHDTNCQEVDEQKFYNYRYGGGTTCSSCPRLMAEQFESRFPPSKWNIYCFYFTDGDNYEEDNDNFFHVIEERFPPDVCNLFGITQVMASNYDNSIKKYMEERYPLPNVKMVSIGSEIMPDYLSNHWPTETLAEDDRNEQIKNAIKKLLGAENKYLEI